MRSGFEALRRTKTILLTLVIDGAQNPGIDFALSQDDRDMLLLEFRFASGKFNQGARLSFDSRHQVKDLPVQRRAGVGIQRQGADQRHFVLGH